jgi:hypothetical protein
MSEIFERHCDMERAITSAWRRVQRSKAPQLRLAEVVGWVITKCPDADRSYVTDEIERRFANSWREYL